MNEDVMLVSWRKIKNQNMVIKLKANEYYDIVINSKRGQVINNTIDNTVWSMIKLDCLTGPNVNMK